MGGRASRNPEHIRRRGKVWVVLDDFYCPYEDFTFESVAATFSQYFTGFLCVPVILAACMPSLLGCGHYWISRLSRDCFQLSDWPQIEANCSMPRGHPPTFHFRFWDSMVRYPCCRKSYSSALIMSGVVIQCHSQRTVTNTQSRLDSAQLRRTSQVFIINIV